MSFYVVQNISVLCPKEISEDNVMWVFLGTCNYFKMTVEKFQCHNAIYQQHGSTGNQTDTGFSGSEERRMLTESATPWFRCHNKV